MSFDKRAYRVSGDSIMKYYTNPNMDGVVKERSQILNKRGEKFPKYELCTVCNVEPGDIFHHYAPAFDHIIKSTIFYRIDMDVNGR